MPEPWKAAFRNGIRASPCRATSIPVAVLVMASGVMWRVPIIRSIAGLFLV